MIKYPELAILKTTRRYKKINNRIELESRYYGAFELIDYSMQILLISKWKIVIKKIKFFIFYKLIDEIDKTVQSNKLSFVVKKVTLTHPLTLSLSLSLRIHDSYKICIYTKTYTENKKLRFHHHQ